MKRTETNIKKWLSENVWNKEGDYYSESRKSVLAGLNKTPFLKEIKGYCNKTGEVLDCGCGDGTDIELLWNSKSRFTGIDLSRIAIGMGRRRLKDRPNVHLSVGDIEELSLPDKKFDLVYSLHVVEHLADPERAIEEMIRVLKPGGHLIIYGSNSGHPFEFSPSTKRGILNYLKREIRLLLRTHLFLFFPPPGLSWDRVDPLMVTQGFYTADSDTPVEPYLGTLLTFLRGRGIKIIKFSSGWEWEKRRNFSSLSFLEKLFEIPKSMARILGKANISPYNYFGPFVYMVGVKAQ